MDSSEVFKPVLAGVVRHGLTALGGALVTGGVMQSSDVSGFVGAGMLLAGVGWSWYQKVGQAQIAALLKKVTAKATVADAAAVAKSTSTVVKVMIAAFLLSVFVIPVAFAADVAIKASPLFPAGYPTTKCGMYYGLGTGGSSGQVEDAAVGTRIVQGELDAILGYSCPFGTAGFWFVEGSVGINNVNGTVNGLALSGPLVVMQRAGAGSPLNALINPFGNSLALPSVPLLPAGVTSGAATPYFFAGLVEQDIATQLGLGAHSHQWLVAPLLGVGLLTRLNGNTSVVDTWAGWQMNSQSFCPGGGQACGKLGNAVRVGVSFKY